MTPTEFTTALSQLERAWEMVYDITFTHFEETNGNPDIKASDAKRMLYEVGALAGACYELEGYLEDLLPLEMAARISLPEE